MSIHPIHPPIQPSTYYKSKLLAFGIRRYELELEWCHLPATVILDKFFNCRFTLQWDGDNLAIYSIQQLDIWWEIHLEYVCIYPMAMYYNYSYDFFMSTSREGCLHPLPTFYSLSPWVQEAESGQGRENDDRDSLLQSPFLVSSTFYPWHAQETLTRQYASDCMSTNLAVAICGIEFSEGVCVSSLWSQPGRGICNMEVNWLLVWNLSDKKP